MIKKNLIYQSIYQILIIFLPFVTAPYTSRVLGAEGIGTYSYTYTIANYFVLFAMLGINNYGNREIAYVRNNREQLNRTFSNIFYLHSIVSILVIAAYTVYVNFTISENKLYATIQSLYVVGALFDINWFYFGIEKFKLTVTRNLAVKLLTVLCIFLFVKTTADLWLYISIMAVGFFISQTVVWLFLKNYVSFTKPVWKDIRKHIGPLLVLFIPVIAVSLYKQMDKIMLGLLTSKIQLGFYENSEKIISIPMGIIIAFGTVMLPRMSNLKATGENKKSQGYMRLSMKYVMLIAFALAFGIAGISTEFVPVFFGREFSESAVLISYLSITIPFIAFANVLRTQYLIPNAKDKQYVISVFMGAIVNLFTNWLLIPSFQALGAAIGTVFAEATVCILQAVMLKKELPVMTYVKISIFPLSIGILMHGLVRIIGKMMGVSLITVLTQIGAGTLFYLIGSAMYLYKTKDQLFLNTIDKLLKK